MYDEIIVNFFKDIKSAANYTTDFKLKIMNLMLTTTLIEDKLEAFGDPESDTDSQAFIAIRRSLIINLDQVYWWLLKNKDCLEDFKDVTVFLNKNQAAVLVTPDEGLLAAVKSDHPRISRVVIGQCLAIFRAMQQLKL